MPPPPSTISLGLNVNPVPPLEIFTSLMLYPKLSYQLFLGYSNVLSEGFCIVLSTIIDVFGLIFLVSLLYAGGKSKSVIKLVVLSIAS